MARRYSRDNRGRFAGGGGGTARGGRLKTASGKKRATQTMQSAAKPKGTPAAKLKAPKTLKYQLAYHGTDTDVAKLIKTGGYKESQSGPFGPGVYTSRKKAVARRYADSAGTSNLGGRVLTHRIPKSRIEPIRKRVSTKNEVIKMKQSIQKLFNNNRIASFGDRQSINLLSKGMADKTLVKPNSTIRRRSPRKPRGVR